MSYIEKIKNISIPSLLNKIEKEQKVTIDENDTLEKKVEYFSRIRKNKDGYHLK